MELKNEIKDLIIKSLDLEDITIDDIKDDEPLFNDGLGLDSVDALELGLAITKRYGIVLDSKNKNLEVIFANVSNLAKFIKENRK